MAFQLIVVRLVTGSIFLILSLILAGCSSPEERFTLKLNLANENLDNGRVEQAIIILEDLKTEYPDHPEILENLAFAFIADEDYPTAGFYFKQLAGKFPDNTDYYKYSAQAWKKAGDTDSAIELYETYLLQNPQDWNTWQNIAELYLDTDQPSKAIRAYSNSSQLRFNPDLSLQAALLATSTGNLRDAEEGFVSLLEVEDPQVAQRAHLGLLDIKHKRRQWGDVETLLNTIDKIYPGAVGEAGLSKVRTDFDSWRQARIEEKKRVQEEEERRKRLEEEQRERSRRLAAAREAAKKKAEEAAREAAKNDTTEVAEVEPLPLFEESKDKPSPALQAIREASIASVSNPSEAIDKLWNIINQGEDLAEAFLELSRAYYHLGQYAESEMTALEALRRDPSNVRFLLAYLETIQKNKSNAKVIAEIRKYRRKLPQNPDLLLLLARVCAEPGGDHSAARSYYDEFFKMAPNHPEIDRARYEASGI